MASDANEDGVERTEASHGSQECMPCRGTGRVISNLGGHAAKVTCPWCEGDGVRHPEIDAQAHWQNAEGGEGPASAGADADGGGAEADGEGEIESAEGAEAA